jgi:hypothetical protein
LWKCTVGFVMSVYVSVCLSVCVEYVGSHCDIYIAKFLQNFHQVQVWLKSDLNIRHLTKIPEYADVNVLLNSSRNEKNQIAFHFVTFSPKFLPFAG